ncbi:MAG: hypothetical protein AB1Z29_12680 [Desulfobacterales bacterium]
MHRLVKFCESGKMPFMWEDNQLLSKRLAEPTQSIGGRRWLPNIYR